MLRRAVVTVAALAMTASVGLAGAGSAATPALHIQPGSHWSARILHTPGCEVVTFSANGTYVDHANGDTGKWSGGGKTISMKWTGASKGFTFNGTFTQTAAQTPEYLGKFAINGENFGKGKLVLGSHCPAPPAA